MARSLWRQTCHAQNRIDILVQCAHGPQSWFWSATSRPGRSDTSCRSLGFCAKRRRLAFLPQSPTVTVFLTSTATASVTFPNLTGSVHCRGQLCSEGWLQGRHQSINPRGLWLHNWLPFEILQLENVFSKTRLVRIRVQTSSST